jgi:uncharacterized cupin superfamily protein
VPDLETSVFTLNAIDWADEVRESGAALSPATEAAVRAGVRRKLLSRGAGGFFSHYAELPGDYTLAPHSHNRDEMLIVVAGEATVIGTDTKLGPMDSVVLKAGVEYGLRTGPDGLSFFTIRSGLAQIQFAE